MTHKSTEKFEDICELKKSILKYVEGQISDGMSANPQEVAILGEYVDMLKDLAEAEKSCHEACYYESVVQAMDESDMAPRMGYNPNRNRMGQYSDGRAGNGGDMRSSSSSNSSNSGRSQSGNRRGYRDPYMRMMGEDMWGDDDMEDPRHGEAFNRFRAAKRHYTETHSEKDRQEMKEHANEHLAETMMTLREMWDDADPDLKKRMKSDLTKLTSEMAV